MSTSSRSDSPAYTRVLFVIASISGAAAVGLGVVGTVVLQHL